MTEYHPVTKEEIGEIYAYLADEEDDDGLRYRTFDILREVFFRPDPLSLLEAWVEHNKRRYIGDRGEYDFFSSDDLNIILEQLRTNPEAVRQQGIKEGWLP